MRPPPALRAPTPHRAVAAVASPMLAYFVARLLLRLVGLPDGLVSSVCLAVGLLLAYRAWTTRIELRPDAVRVHNLLATSTIARDTIRRVNDRGRVESRGGDSPRTTHLPVDALHEPWWAFGTGRSTYAVNRERVRSWLRLGPSQSDGDIAA